MVSLAFTLIKKVYFKNIIIIIMDFVPFKLVGIKNSIIKVIRFMGLLFMITL